MILNILVADDYKKSRNHLEEILTKKGFEVISAKDGAEALALYKESPTSIAFIDWEMPKLNGIELCQKIREIGDDTYILLVSGKTKKRNMVEGLDAGADDFVLKPYAEDIVLSRVDIAKKILEARINKASEERPAIRSDIEPILILNEEHKLIHRMTGILEVVSNMLGDGFPLPKKLLEWGTSSVFILNWELHESKEYYYIKIFINRAKEIHGKTSQLYSWSSLTQIMKEHEIIKTLLTDMQKAAKDYDVGNRKSIQAFRNAITRYLPLIRFHASREEDVFFPFTQRYFTEKDAAQLLRNFQQVEDEIGVEKIQTRLETIEQLEKILKIKERN